MKIVEIPPAKQINVTKFEMSCDLCDPTMPKPLPQVLNFFMLMVGVVTVVVSS